MRIVSVSPRSQSAIDAEASLWLAKRRMQGAREFDQVGLDTWLNADARHQAAYAQMSRAATLVSSLEGLEATSSPARRRIHWRALAPVGALAAAAAAAVVIFAPALRAPQATHATEVAQIDRMTLSDGSVVTLGPASHLEVRFSDRERRVVLTSGEAFFEVTHDGARPFYVEAGVALVRVVGTKFDVHRSDDHVRISVAEGVVQVRAAAIPLARQNAEPVVLRSGDGAQIAERTFLFSARPLVATKSPASAGAWREGQLTYIETPLSELVADLNRYYAPGVRLADQSLESYRLTASFKVDELDAFFSTLSVAAPVVVSRGPEGEIILSRALE